MRKLLAALLWALAAVPAVAQKTVELKEGWEFRRADDNTWRKATVPGTVHTDLLAHQLIPDPYVGANEKGLQWIDKKDWEYRCSFTLDDQQQRAQAAALDFRGLDTYADVYLNGQLILRAKNMFVAQEVNVKRLLRAKNELRILFHSPIAHDMPRFLQDRIVYPAGNDASDIPLSVHARKAPYHYGWDWGPRLVTSGIWRPVLLRTWDHVQLKDVWIRQLDLSPERASLEAQVTIYAQRAGSAVVRVSDGRSETGVKVQVPAGDTVLAIPLVIQQPQLWWPNGLGKPFLYEAKVTIEKDGETQVYKKRFGLRTIEVVNAPDKDGTSFFLKVNGRPVFMKGANYIPSDNFLPRVTAGHYARMFDDMRQSNFNMVRVWGGGVYEDDRFYELADENGILVWQDFMFACTLYPSDKDFLQQVREEAIYNIRRLRNHPSLALWCGNNEVAVAIKNWGWKEGYGYTDQQWSDLQKGYDVLFKSLLPDMVKAEDPGRFYFHSSPISNWGKAEDFRHGDNHYWGVWHGMEWFEAYETHVPRFMSEYGFQSFPDLHTVRKFADSSQWDLHSFVMLSHQKSAARGNTAIQTYMDHYYRKPKDFKAFLYMSQLLQAQGMKTGIEAHRRAMPYCMGSLYWQFNDCWPGPSWSGIDYYGRWKATQYAIKDAFTPLLLSVAKEGAVTATYVVSDTPADGEMRLEQHLISMNGAVLRKWESPVNAKGNASTTVQRSTTADILRGADSTGVILYSKLIKNGQLMSDNVFYFVAPRYMQLPAAEPAVTVALRGKDLIVSVSGQQLLKNVCLFLEGDDQSHFSRNYFDVLPGATVEAVLKTRLSLAEVKKQLRVTHLAQAMEP
ncbi:beta-mannosidase [Chitinophaga lutea]